MRFAFSFSSCGVMLGAVARKEERIAVQKTYKLFIGGKFVRSESGRVTPAQVNGQVIANFPRASRKDFRDAVMAARGAVAGWSNVSAYLRGQILYRAAEILEMRRSELEAEVARAVGKRNGRAREEVGLAIDHLVYYAGWTDKFSQIFSAVNPVASPHFNFTTPEPTGVVVVVCPNEPPLLALVSLVAPVILSGNTSVVLTSTTQHAPGADFFGNHRNERSASRSRELSLGRSGRARATNCEPHECDCGGGREPRGKGERGLATRRRIQHQTLRAASAESPGLEDDGRKPVLDSRYSGDENGVASDRTVEGGREPDLA